MRPFTLVMLCLLVTCAAPGPGGASDDAPRDTGRSLGARLAEDAGGGYAYATQPREFRFPADHGPHPRYRTEWWYFTGNLATGTERRFGYELTFFRIAIAPEPPQSPSAWATNQIYMAHLAVTDVAGRRFEAFERFARGAAGLAGARAEPFRVWLEDWSVRSLRNARTPWRLSAAAGDVTLELTLDPVKPPVLQGDRGLSRKSGAEGNASYYYSLSRIDTRGSLTIGDERHAVRGLSWMDREWSTSALGPEQSGWDWFALQLDDGSELMFYRLRRRDGTADPHSAGALIGPDGDKRALAADDVRVEVLDHWTAPDGTRYPSRWRLHVEPADLRLTVEPLLADQELRLSVRYWEGAVMAQGDRAGASVHARGYVELAGY